MLNRTDNRDTTVPPDDRHSAWITAARQQAGTLQQGLTGSSAKVGLFPGRTGTQRLASDAIPGYDILGEIHRGGQGVVYRATQKSTGRTVALKVMREGRFASTQDHTRFDREVHILAHLSHPSIVSIIDRGAADHCDYFAMDYIDGQPLDLWSREQSPSLTDLLNLFRRICDAVQAAHLRGIIHRDLKPGNIIIDREGRPHILDFGLAKTSEAGDASEATRIGEFVGSIPWASPEQAAGKHDELDLRSDVYSLGTILYFLTVGEMPHPVQRNMGELLRAIQTVEPPRPSKKNVAIDDELEAIILTALRKEPDRRYQTAGELSRDILHYLRKEPIQAKRESFAYVFRKALARHRATAAIAILLLITLIVSTIVSVIFAQRAAHERNMALLAEQRERKARVRADHQTAKATLVNDFLQHMLSSADPEVRQGRELSAREMLDEAARDLDRGKMAAQPDVEQQLRLTLGSAYLSIAAFDAAQPQIEKALRLSESLYGHKSKAYALSLRWMGELADRRDHSADAERYYRQALEILENLQPPDELEIGYTKASLALTLESAAKLDESRALTRESLDHLRKSLGPRHHDVGVLESILAQRLHASAEALPLAQQSVETLRAALGDRDPAVARAMHRLGNAYSGQGDLQSAEETLTKALALKREVFGDDHPQTLGCVEDLSFVYSMRGQLPKSLALMTEFVPHAERTFGPDNRFRVDYLLDVAKSNIRPEQAEQREAAYREALAVAQRANLSDSSQAVGARLGLTDIVARRGNCDEAEGLLDQIDAVRTRLPGQFPPATLGRMKLLRGQVLACRGRFAEAEPLILEGARSVRSRQSSSLSKASVVSVLTNFYESWEKAEPGQGHQAKADPWRAQIATSQP